MNEEITLKTRDWEKLLTFTQKQKYRAAITQGWFADYHGTEWRHETFYGAYIWKHPKYLNVVRMFEKLLGHKPTWEDVTDDNLRDLFEELKTKYAPNSVRTLCATIKAVIRENDASKEIPSATFGKILRSKSVPVQAVYLTDEEIKRVMEYHPRGANKRYVQRMFVIECLTGARMSDCEKMSTQNIDDSGRMLVYVAQKTKSEVRVPVHRYLRPWLVCGTADEPVGGLPDSTFNRNLQEICKSCGIDDPVKVFQKGKERHGRKWQFVTSHTGRRSFATNLSKKGVSIDQISLLMGHMNGNVPNIQMTQRYIVGKMTINSEVMRIFGAYDYSNDAADEELESE